MGVAWGGRRWLDRRRSFNTAYKSCSPLTCGFQVKIAGHAAFKQVAPGPLLVWGIHSGLRMRAFLPAARKGLCPRGLPPL
jgi:hypothetical protein